MGKVRHAEQGHLLSYAKRNLADGDIASLALGQKSTEYEEVDFSQNDLTSDGIRDVMDFCCRCRNLRVVKMYKNRICDDGAEWFAKLVHHAQHLEEIHISHNQLSIAGVKCIIRAAERSRAAGARPLWLRMEQNEVENPDGALRELEAKWSVCGRGDERWCTTRSCCWRRKVHLPFFYMMKPPNPKTAAAARDERPRRSACVARDNATSSAAKVRARPGGPLDLDDEEEDTEDDTASSAPCTKWKAKASTDHAAEERRSEQQPSDEHSNSWKEDKIIVKLSENSLKDRADSSTSAGQSPELHSCDGAAPPIVSIDVEGNQPLPIALGALGEDILEGVKKARRTQEDRDFLDECMKSLQEGVHACLGEEQGWRAAAFGSMSTGFGTSDCDLDVTVYEGFEASASSAAPKDTKAESDNLGTLMSLRTYFADLKDSNFSVRNTILNARIPILKLKYKELDIDLSVNNTKPLKNTRLLKAYTTMDPMVVELGVAVKLWAKGRGLSGAAAGHLSSYAFVLMVVYYLQVAGIAQMPSLQACGSDDHFFMSDVTAEAKALDIGQGWSIQVTLDILLAGFFAFYAGTPGPGSQAFEQPFDWGTEVVSIRLGRREKSENPEFDSLSKRTDQRLHIEDPFERGRNLRDVLRMQPVDSEALLYDQIVFMDQACRAAFTQQFLAQMAISPPFNSPDIDADTPWLNGQFDLSATGAGDANLYSHCKHPPSRARRNNQATWKRRPGRINHPSSSY